MNINKLALVKTRLETFNAFVEEILGTSRIRKSQEVVRLNEMDFTEKRNGIEELKIQLQVSSNSLDEIRRLLDRSDRTSEDYLSHLTNERTILIEHRKIMNSLNLLESQERNSFRKYSSSVRDAYEIERYYSDQMKFYSLVFSAACTIIGLLGSTMLFKIRERRQKDTLELVKSISISPENLKNVLQEITNSEKISNEERNLPIDLDKQSHLFQTAQNFVLPIGTGFVVGVIFMKTFDSLFL